MKNRFLFLLLVSLTIVPTILIAQNPERVWEVDLHKYPNTMTCTAQVFLDGELATDLEIGAFCGDECRGIATPVYYSAPVNRWYWFLTIQGDGSLANEMLYFYARKNGVEQECYTSLCFNFADNANIGDPFHPTTINFNTPISNYYILITDERQLVAGRQYLIANGREGTVKFVGANDSAHGIRLAVNSSVSNHKVHEEAAIFGLDQTHVYQFTLGGEAELWTLADMANNGYLAKAAGNALRVDGDVSTQAQWNVVVQPDGTAHLMVSDSYLHFSDESFSFSNDESDLYLYAQCELISGMMETLSVTEPAQMYVVESGNILNVNDLSTINSTNLIIEDGAQLINASENVLAMVQKDISKFDDVEVADGYYTMASPTTTSVENGSNLLWNEYDLYRFDETDLERQEWENYKNDEFTDFDAGRGYLYANANDFVVNFIGALNSTSATVDLTYTDSRTDDLKGFNLIGNPYPHAIKKGVGCAVDDSHLATGYYVLDHSGTWTACTDEQSIASCQGVLIQTCESVELTINKIVASSTRSASSPQINISVSDGNYNDRAFVCLKEGAGLEKISHFNDKAPKIFVSQNGCDYAVATLQKDEKSVSLPIGFISSHNGKHTISIDAENVDLEYFQLVDNLTGAHVDLLKTCNYDFTTNTNDYASRFKLVFKVREEYDCLENAPFCHYSNGQLSISNIDKETTLKITDLMGRILTIQKVNGCFEQTINFATGIYVIQLGDKVQKIVVK